MSALRIGIIGGTGWIGRAMAEQLLHHQVITAEQLWIANRSGQRLNGDHTAGIHYTQDHQALVDACDVVVLSVRPQDMTAINISLHSQLLVSVMAGVTIEQLVERTQATSVVRAMPNAAIEIGQSYTPWYSRYLSLAHQDIWLKMVNALGYSQVCETEHQLIALTALTGSGQGILTAIATSMIQASQVYAMPSEMMDQAMRYLFSGIGQLMQADFLSPPQRAQVCLDYAGTTAAAISGMRQHGLQQAIQAGVDAAFEKANSNMASST